MAAPAFSWVNYSNNDYNDNTSANIGSASAASTNGAFNAGSVLIAQLVLIGNAPHTITAPAGWTIIGAKVNDGNLNDVAWYSHVCDGTETGSFAFSWTTTSFWSWILACYSGVATTPIDDALAIRFSDGGSGSQVAGPVVPANNPDLLILFAESDYSLIKPADMTSRMSATIQNSGTVQSILADKVLSAAGSISDTFTPNAWRNGSYALITLSPGAAGVVLGDYVLDAGLAGLDATCDKIFICVAMPSSYANATSGANSLGSYNFGAGNAFTSDSSYAGGMQISSVAIAAGSVSTGGTVGAWAAVDSANSRLLASGPLTGSIAVTAGQSFSLTSLMIQMPRALS